MRASRIPVTHLLRCAGSTKTYVYLDDVRGIAQIEDVVTADTHIRRGYANAVLDTALQHASGCELVFLLADPLDWPHNWYARRGFTPIGRFHAFTRTEAVN